MEACSSIQDPHLTYPEQRTEARIPSATWRLKVPVLFLVLFFNMGCIVANNVLPQMKHLLMEHMSDGRKKLTAAQFGVISASNSFINSTLPILAGVIVDYYGPTLLSLLCSVFIVVGTAVQGAGAQQGSFSVFLGGEILMAVGTTSIMTCQMKLYTHWFRGSSETGPGLIGFIIGLSIGMKRVYSTIGHQSAIPIKNATGKWYWAFWLSTILSAVSLLFNFVYITIESTLPSYMRVKSGHKLLNRNIEVGSKRANTDPGIARILYQHIKNIGASLKVLPASFWTVTILQLLQAGAISSFESNSTDVIRKTRHLSEYRAAYISGLDRIIPIVMTPIFGLVFDAFGYRPFFVSYTAALYILVFCLTIFTNVNELCPILLGSLALSSFEIPFVASIPLLVPSQASVGTAYGVWESFSSAGSVIVNVASGAIQDRSIQDQRISPAQEYNNVFYLLISIKVFEFFIGFCYFFLDLRYFGSVLTMSERRRVHEKQAEKSLSSKNQKLCVPRKSFTIIGCIITVATIITSYVLFINYSL